MKKRIVALAASLFLIFSACAPRIADISGSSGSIPESSAPSVSSSSQTASDPVTSAPEVPQPELTLYDWWNDYIYDAVYPLQGNYPSRPQYNSRSMIEFCGIRMLRDGVTKGKVGAEKGNEQILPKETLDQYTRRYFDVPLEKLDTLKIESEDGADVLMYLSIDAQNNTPDESLCKNDVFTLAGQEENPDGTVTLTVTHGENDQTYFVMGYNGDETYHFQKIWRETMDAPKGATLTGSYKTAHTLLGTDTSAGGFPAYGEIGGSLLLTSHWSDSAYVTLSLVSTEDMSEQIYELLLGKQEKYLSATADENRILIVTSERIITMGAGFSNVQEQKIPDAFLSTVQGEIPVFDLSADLSKAVYCDDEGLALFDFATGTRTLLAKHPNYVKDENATGKEMMSWQTYSGAQFIDGDRKIAAGIGGYESMIGNVVYDLAERKLTTMPNELGYEAQISTWTDPETGIVHPLTTPAGAKYIVRGSAGDRAMLCGFGGRRYQLYLLNTETMQLEPQDFKFESPDADPHVIGGGKNGKLLLGYFSFIEGGGEYILAG